jgi:hypothetical protein
VPFQSPYHQEVELAVVAALAPAAAEKSNLAQLGLGLAEKAEVVPSPLLRDLALAGALPTREETQVRAREEALVVLDRVQDPLPAALDLGQAALASLVVAARVLELEQRLVLQLPLFVAGQLPLNRQ